MAPANPPATALPATPTAPKLGNTVVVTAATPAEPAVVAISEKSTFLKKHPDNNKQLISSKALIISF